MIIISPSLLSADFANLQSEIADIENAGAEYLHLDVMDGAFVPNITFGAPVIKKLRPHSKMVFDTHLMINEPIKYIDDFAKAGADIITIHIESTDKVAETLDKIKAHNIRAGLSVKPGTPASAVYEYLDKTDLILVMTVEPGFGGQAFMPDMLPKIKELKNEIARRGLDIKIEVDGGITKDNIKTVADAGADIAVAGSAVFGKPDRKAALDALAKNL